MKFTVTKVWKEVPFKMFTMMTSLDNAFRIDTGTAAPTGEGIGYRGVKLEKITDSKVWIKLDKNDKMTTVEVDLANFI